MLYTREPTVHSRAFVRLLLESRLITEHQLSIAHSAKAETGAHIDDILIQLGFVERQEMLKVMSKAWHIPTIDLTTGWVDNDLVGLLPGELYLEENWMPVRDQANGSVLIATAREPAEERAARIGAVMASPVEFAVATSTAIRVAVLLAYDVPHVGFPRRLYRAVARPRD